MNERLPIDEPDPLLSWSGEPLRDERDDSPHRGRLAITLSVGAVKFIKSILSKPLDQIVGKPFKLPSKDVFPDDI